MFLLARYYFLFLSFGLIICIIINFFIMSLYIIKKINNNSQVNIESLKNYKNKNAIYDTFKIKKRSEQIFDNYIKKINKYSFVNFSKFIKQNFLNVDNYKIIYYQPVDKNFSLKKNKHKTALYDFRLDRINLSLSPIVLKINNYNYQLSLDEFKYLYDNKKYSIENEGSVLISTSHREFLSNEKNWAFFEYIDKDNAYIFLLPFNWRNEFYGKSLK